MSVAVLFLPMIVFAIRPENFAAFAANENKEVITMPDLAAAALAAAGAFAPYKTTEMARPVFTWFARVTRLRTVFVMVAMLVIVIVFVMIALLGAATIRFVLLVRFRIAIRLVIATLFTPVFVHSIHLISRSVI